MKKILIASLLTILASCGKSGPKSEDAYTSAYGSSDGKSCESNVISDYNKLSRICSIQNENDRMAVANCIQQADTMISKYPNLNCTATKPSRTTLEDETVTITNESIRKLQNGFTSENYFNYKSGAACGVYFLKDLAAAVVEQCKQFDLKTKNEASICKNAIDGILTQYPDFDCTYKSKEASEEAAYKYADFKKVSDELNSILEN